MYDCNYTAKQAELHINRKQLILIHARPTHESLRSHRFTPSNTKNKRTTNTHAHLIYVEVVGCVSLKPTIYPPTHIFFVYIFFVNSATSSSTHT